MKNKYFRYFFREYEETTVGVINADDEQEAREIFKLNYKDVFSDVIIEEIEFKNNCCELYYGG